MKNKKILILASIVVVVCIILAVVFASSSGISSTNTAKLLELGNKYLLDQNYEEAILAFNKAIEIEPKNIDARLGLAEIYKQTGDFNNAEMRLKEILDIEPSSIDTIILLADLFVKKGNKTEALALLEAAISEASNQQAIDTLQSFLNTIIEEGTATSTLLTTQTQNFEIIIDAIDANKSSVSPIMDSTTSGTIAKVDSIIGSMSREGEEDTYDFSPSVDGRYRFEFSNIPNGVYHSMYIYNSGWEHLDSNYAISNGSGLTMTLDAGQTYYVKIKQAKNTGSYTLNVGYQKQLTDISGLTAISDSTQYTDQENNYAFTPQLDGRYRFEFSNIPNGVYHSMYIYNSGWEHLDSNYAISNGSGLTMTLDAGQTYYVKIKQAKNTGSYTLNVGYQKQLTDISGLTAISDSTQYTDQENNYAFTPQLDGSYRFEFSNIPNGVYHSMYIYNSGWEHLDSNYAISNGSGLTMTLDAGQTYYVKIKQAKNTGSYTLNVGYQKQLTDISGLTAISDSTQYTDQENNYAFTPQLDGRYRFEFSNIPNGVYHSMYIYNSGWEHLDSNYAISNGSGLTMTLDAGQTYYVKIKQAKNTGSYTLNVGYQKQLTDISGLTAISDSTQYTDQENNYAFTPQLDGRYRFEFSNIPNGVYHSMYIYNSGWEHLDSNYAISNGSGLTMTLDAGQTYYVKIKQAKNTGSYTLNIGYESTK